jgi:hypothetical protein
MTKKLTLSIDEEVIEQAKELAARENTSVSGMFTRMIRGMARRTKNEIPISPAVRKLIGIAKLPKGKTYEDILTEALMEKYGIDK